MRIVHDPNRCATTGICESIAPDLFEVSDDGVLIVKDPQPSDELRALATEALEACPTSALRIAD